MNRRSGGEERDPLMTALAFNWEEWTISRTTQREHSNWQAPVSISRFSMAQQHLCYATPTDHGRGHGNEILYNSQRHVT